MKQNMSSIYITFIIITIGVGGYFLTTNKSNILIPQPQPTVTPSIAQSISSPTKKVYQCNVDADCISVRADYCGCSAGGKQTAINKKYADEWNNQFATKETIACAQVYLCNKDETPKCIGNRCQLIHK